MLHTVTKILKAILVGVYIVVIVSLLVGVNGLTVLELPHLKLANAVTLTDILVLIA
jgi:hypothetical protein